MKKIWFIASIAALIVAGASGCSNSGTEEDQVYTLSGEVTEENGIYYVTVDTDFKLTNENYGGSPVEGEGHVHFYLNDSLIGPITSEEPFEIKYADDGTNKIKLELANHNHSTFGVMYELTFEK
jgi:hypothetical protein